MSLWCTTRCWFWSLHLTSVLWAMKTTVWQMGVFWLTWSKRPVAGECKVAWLFSCHRSLSIILVFLNLRKCQKVCFWLITITDRTKNGCFWEIERIVQELKQCQSWGAFRLHNKLEHVLHYKTGFKNSLSYTLCCVTIKWHGAASWWMEINRCKTWLGPDGRTFNRK